jgi:hypothetical protein
MLRAEQGDQTHALRSKKDIDRAGTGCTETGVVGNQADPLVLKYVKVLFGEDINAGQDRSVTTGSAKKND